MKPVTGCSKDKEVQKPINIAATKAVTYQGQLQVNCRKGCRDFEIEVLLINGFDTNPMINPISAIAIPMPGR